MSTVYATSTISLRQQVVAALLKGLTTTVTTTGTAGDPTLVIGTSAFVNTAAAPSPSRVRARRRSPARRPALSWPATSRWPTSASPAPP